MQEIEDFIRDAAAKRGIHPDTAILVARSEGGVDEYARRGTFATGSSWWPFQLHFGGPGYEQYGTVAGMGTGFTDLTGWQPGDPRAWRDSVRYALNRAKAGGWTPWYGAAAAGVSRWYGIDRSVPWDASAETWDYERPEEPAVPDAKLATVSEDDVNFRAGPGVSFDKLHAPLKQGSTVWLTDAPPVTAEGHTWRQVALGLVGWVAEEYLSGGEATGPPVSPSLAFDPTTPTYFQRNPWTCSIGAVIWCLRASGIDVTPEEAYDAMVPTYVNSDDGLLDASGAGIVKVLREHWGISAYNLAPVSFAQVAHLAGVYPLALGLHNWGMPGGHWSGVRGFDGTQITLANPGGTGPRFGQQALTRDQFEARGPASAVVLTGRV